MKRTKSWSRRKHNFTLTEKQRAEIETALLTAEPHIEVRLRCLLLCAAGKQTPDVADEIGGVITRATISRWLKLYREKGLPYLLSLKKPGSGLSATNRPLTITATVFAQLEEISKKSPTEFGYPNMVWTYDLLRDVAVAQGLIPEVTANTVGLAFRRMGKTLPVSLRKIDYAALFSDTDISLLSHVAETGNIIRKLRAKTLLLVLQGKKNREIADELLQLLPEDVDLTEETIQRWKNVARKRGVAFLLR